MSDIVEVVRREQGIKLCTKDGKLFGFGHEALDQLLHGTDGTLHVKAIVLDAERWKIHRAAFEKWGVEAFSQALRDNHRVAPLRWRIGISWWGRGVATHKGKNLANDMLRWSGSKCNPSVALEHATHLRDGNFQWVRRYDRTGSK